MSNSDHFLVRLVEADLAPLVKPAKADPVRLQGDRVPDRNVGHVDRRFLGHNSALLIFHRVGAGMPLHLVDASDHYVIVIDDLRDVAALALVAAGNHDHVVALLDLAHGHRTSGASDTIFMKRSVRSSRVTGPKMRVPIGSSLGVSSTAALVSNLILAPSSRRTPCPVRTTTPPH